MDGPGAKRFKDPLEAGMVNFQRLVKLEILDKGVPKGQWVVVLSKGRMYGQMLLLFFVGCRSFSCGLLLRRVERCHALSGKCSGECSLAPTIITAVLRCAELRSPKNRDK